MATARSYFGHSIEEQDAARDYEREKQADYAPRSKAPAGTQCDAQYRYWAAGTMASCSWPNCACR